MTNNTKLGRRREHYWASKGFWLWSCVGCIVAIRVIGFAWAGWVIGGTTTKMAADATVEAGAQPAAADCIDRFANGPDAIMGLAAPKRAESFNRSHPIQKGG